MSMNGLVIQQVQEAFCETEHPGDAFLIGSHDGCEPAEVIAPFLNVTNWADVSIETLDENSAALSFFSEGGFRFFLPSYLVADLNGHLEHADPVFHLTFGFSDQTVEVPAGGHLHDRSIGGSALINPRRYGALTSYDYSRFRLSIFTREEAGAIVAYLTYRLDSDTDGFDTESIDAALASFWRERAENAATHRLLRKHAEAEAAYFRDLERS